MPKEIQLADAKCTGLVMQAPVQFKKEASADADFVIEAYTGAVVDRWWGKLAIEIDGIRSKQNMPVFRSHRYTDIVGFSTRAWKDKSFFVAGKFSAVTPLAQEVKGLANEGFPWQASIGVNPLKILALEKGASHPANGKMVDGPGEIWLESEVVETSFVPFGADDGTSVAMLTRFEERQQEKAAASMEDKSMEGQITLELLKKDHHDMYQEILALGRKEGAQAERDRIKAVRAQSLPGHEALVELMVEDGVTTGAQAAIRILQAEKQLRQGVAGQLAADAAAVPSVPVTPPPSGVVTQDLSTEEGMKAVWDKDKQLREEFSGDFEVFKAYQQNKHRAKVRG